jgi:hypothetical protein
VAFSAEQRTNLQAIRLRLLELHKVLLDHVRAAYERENGMIGSPGEYLQLVLNHEQFAWLRTLSGLIVEFDELVSPRTKTGPEDAAALVTSTRGFLVLNENGTDYQQKYWAAIQESPDVVIAHCKAEKLLQAG